MLFKFEKYRGAASPAARGDCVADQHDAIRQHAADANDLDKQHNHAVPAAQTQHVHLAIDKIC